MNEKCSLCSTEIKKGFLDKIEGTIIKTKEGEKLILKYICPNCQKEHKEKLKEKILK